LNPLKKLFKQTAIYGLATVLPRMLSFILVPIYTSVMATGLYGEVSEIFAWFAIFNVFLAYGMETAFFRFYHSSDEKDTVVSTSLISIIVSTFLFLILGLTFQNGIAEVAEIDVKYIRFTIYILALDALVIVPFAWLRANEKPIKYAVVKIINVVINLGLNIFFLLLLPELAEGNSEGFCAMIYQPDFQITYIFIANLIASAVTLSLMLGSYLDMHFSFDTDLWKRMMKYAWPVLIAGIAFTINEVFDRILLKHLLDPSVAKSKLGMYSACYKLGLFMTLFATAFRMGIEPFFFSHSDSENPQKTYAQITNYFVLFGSVILLAVIVFADVLKVLFVRDEAYWEAMSIVPIIILASFFLGIYHNLSVWYKVTDKTRFGAFISVIGAIITIGINFIFIPKIGYMASGKSRYPVPYNLRKVFFYLGISILFSVISFYGFDRNLWVGIPLLAIFLALIYKLENDKLRRIFLKKADD